MIHIIQRTNSFNNLLEAWIESTHELCELFKEVQNITDYALKKAKLRQFRLKEVERDRYRQLLIKCIRLLTVQTKKNIAKTNITTKIFLKNIFGYNNSTEPNNNK
ncbi:hypothetical protein OZY32_10675 [Aliarcobacter cryaerophilus]|uniref:hypothetical protein n=1 Tax=Aliarcobacter cryaerophilus TaxID=28198 RepID=UPI003BB03E14